MKAKLVEEENVILVTHSIKVTENVQIAGMLQLAIIAENTEVLDLPQIQSRLSACEVKEIGMFSLSPTKLLIVLIVRLMQRTL